jgi:hypothetical protein
VSKKSKVEDVQVSKTEDLSNFITNFVILHYLVGFELGFYFPARFMTEGRCWAALVRVFDVF